MNVMKKGSVFKANGWVPGWYRIKLANGGWGWVLARDVHETDEPAHAAAAPELHVQRTPPIIRMEPSPYLSNTLRTVVSGRVTDESGVKYVYIMVNNDKVYLNTPEKAGETRELNFKAEVPLEEGPNTVTIIARDTSDLVTTRSFITSAKTALVKGVGEEYAPEIR